MPLLWILSAKLFTSFQLNTSRASTYDERIALVALFAFDAGVAGVALIARLALVAIEVLRKI